MTRRLAPFLLSLALCLAAFGVAVVRVEGALSWQITVCTGDGVVEVSLDADGNPVARPHHCPDCLASVALGLPPASHRLPPQTNLPEPPGFAAVTAAPGLGRLPPKAQGPPAFV